MQQFISLLLCELKLDFYLCSSIIESYQLENVGFVTFKETVIAKIVAFCDVKSFSQRCVEVKDEATASPAGYVK
jgi:hypothetical protein